MNRKKMFNKNDVANTLLARDYKGLPNIQPSNGVVERLDQEEDAALTDIVGI